MKILPFKVKKFSLLLGMYLNANNLHTSLKTLLFEIMSLFGILSRCKVAFAMEMENKGRGTVL